MMKSYMSRPHFKKIAQRTLNRIWRGKRNEIDAIYNSSMNIKNLRYTFNFHVEIIDYVETVCMTNRRVKIFLQCWRTAYFRSSKHQGNYLHANVKSTLTLQADQYCVT